MIFKWGLRSNYIEIYKKFIIENIILSEFITLEIGKKLKKFKMKWNLKNDQIIIKWKRLTKIIEKNLEKIKDLHSTRISSKILIILYKKYAVWEKKLWHQPIKSNNLKINK